MKFENDYEVVSRYLNELENGVFEVRDLSTGYSGYFDDVGKAVDEIDRYLAGGHRSLYVTLNEVSREWVGDRMNKGIQRQKKTVSDKDIVSRRYILIDLDPDRPKGTNSTPEQKAEAFSIAKDVARLMGDKFDGYRAKMVTDSGNGYHLYFPIEGFPVDGHEVKAVLESVKNEMGKLHPDTCVKVDTTVGNASRIVRISGIPNTKTETPIETKIRFCNPSVKPLKYETVKPFFDAMKTEAKTKGRAGVEVVTHPKGAKDFPKVKAALEAIDPDLDHGGWVKVLYALRSWEIEGHHEKGKELAEAWSEGGSKFDAKAEDQLQRIFDDEPNSDISIGTLFHIAKESGWTPTGYLFDGVKLPEKQATLKPIPKVFPEAMEAKAREIERATGTPPEVTLPSMLSVLSLAVCDKANVPVLNEWKESLVWNSILVAESGERKSATLKRILQPITDEAGRLMDDYKAKKQFFDLKAKQAEKDKAKATTAEDIQRIDRELETHRPSFPGWVIGDVTPEAFLQTLADTENRGIAKLMLSTDEGKLITNTLTGHYTGGQTNNAIFLNGYDGTSYTSNRITSGYVHLKNVHTPILAFIQPSVVENALQSHGDEMEGQGLLPRLELIPYKGRGTTWENVSTSEGKGSKEWGYLVEDLLRIDTDELKNGEKWELNFSADAMKLWGELYDTIQKRRSQSDPLKGYRAKMEGKLARLSGLLHLAYGFSVNDEIEADTVKNAWELVQWFESTRSIFVKGNGSKLARYTGYLVELVQTGKDYMTTRDFYRATNLTKGEALPVLERLEGQGFVVQSGKGWRLNPDLATWGQGTENEEREREREVHQIPKRAKTGHAENSIFDTIPKDETNEAHFSELLRDKVETTDKTMVFTSINKPKTEPTAEQWEALERLVNESEPTPEHPTEKTIQPESVETSHKSWEDQIDDW
jgi:hypothetical protein